MSPIPVDIVIEPDSGADLVISKSLVSFIPDISGDYDLLIEINRDADEIFAFLKDKENERVHFKQLYSTKGKNFAGMYTITEVRMGDRAIALNISK